MRKIEILCDAACDNNSKLKLMGIGVVVLIDGQRVPAHDVVEMVGTNGTNNIGEYMGLIAAIKKAKELEAEYKGDCYFLVSSDSQLIVNQFKGTFDCNQPHLEELLLEARKERRELNVPSSRFRVQWISRKFNTEADILSKKAITDYLAELEQ